MEHQISPLVLSIINMTIVFAVLFFLALIIKLIKVVVDTQVARWAPKNQAAQVAHQVAGDEVKGSAREPQVDPKKLAAVCAAVAAYLTEEEFQVVSIRRMLSPNPWVQAARLENIISSQVLRSRRSLR